MKLVESILNEAKDLTVYKNLVTRLADYSQEYPATGVDKLFDQAVEGGLKIIPKDKKALEILGFVITNLSNPPKVVQDLLNLRFSDLPILLKPLYKGKNGRKEVAFWGRGGKVSDKVKDLIDWQASGKKGQWVDVDGNKVTLLEIEGGDNGK